MSPTAILSIVVAVTKFGVKYGPALAVVMAYLPKLAAGDFSSVGEMLAAIYAAVVAVNSGTKALKATNAVAKLEAKHEAAELGVFTYKAAPVDSIHFTSALGEDRADSDPR